MSVKPIFNNIDAFLDEDVDDVLHDDTIHIRKHMRSGSKMITTIQNLDKSINKQELLKKFRKQFACNGNIANHEEYGEVIQLQGDQGRNICQFLREHNYATEDQIMIH